jgi:DNA-binding NarL/FixJ family response regulator
MKRLLIVADHPMVVDAIRLALRQTAGFQVVGFVDGRCAVRAQLAELRPDVVLVDEMQHPDHALARIEEVADELPDAKLLLLTTHMDDGSLEKAFEAGAQAAFSKTVQPVALGTLLRETIRSNVVHRYERQRASEVSCPLTTREIEILGLAAQGQTNGTIARQLWITEQTVKFHLSNTYRKLGVANRTEAGHYAYMHDLVTPHELVAA